MKASQIVKSIADRDLKADADEFRVGDTVEVHVRIVEGEKERIQLFTGTVIGRKNGNRSSACFTVRSPRVEKIVVKKSGKVRRAKLNFLRGRTGKGTKLAERRGTRGGKKKKAAAEKAAEKAAEASAPEEPTAEAPASEGTAAEETTSEE
jgi:large subunit ribosomal protein L19